MNFLKLLNGETLKLKQDFSNHTIKQIGFEKSIGKNDMMNCVYILKLNHDGTKLGVSSGKKKVFLTYFR